MKYVLAESVVLHVFIFTLDKKVFVSGIFDLRTCRVNRMVVNDVKVLKNDRRRRR